MPIKRNCKLYDIFNLVWFGSVQFEILTCQKLYLLPPRAIAYVFMVLGYVTPLDPASRSVFGQHTVIPVI